MKKLLFLMLAGLLLCACSKDDKGNDGGTPPPTGLTFTEPLHDWSLTVEQVKSREKRTLKSENNSEGSIELFYYGENAYVKEVRYFFPSTTKRLFSGTISFICNEENFNAVLAFLKNKFGSNYEYETSLGIPSYSWTTDKMQVYFKYNTALSSLILEYYNARG